MGRKRKTRENNFTERFRSGDYDADNVDTVERLDHKDKNLTARKIAQTAVLRADGDAADWDALPMGRVKQVYSLYLAVEVGGTGTAATAGRPGGPAGRGPEMVQCTVRKTLNKRRETTAVVGDFVRVRLQPRRDEAGPLEGVIERVEPRTTLLTRADSFKAIEQHPIVANATRMLIVVSVVMPRPKWGLVDRMLVAARAGGLEPVICLNKIDLGELEPESLAEAREVMAHYRKLGVRAEETCATRAGSEAILSDVLRGQITVLAGHSGVGKSSLVRVVDPALDIRVGEVSAMHEKGKHTTTSARVYPVVKLGAEVIDTPGVKLFGLWNVTAEGLGELYPDIEEGWAPAWRVESRARIEESLGVRRD